MPSTRGTCFACKKNNLLTDEHIIPQSIGGKLVAKLYCKSCNDTFGHSLDSEVAKQFGYIGTILNIKRERGRNRTFEVDKTDDGTTLVIGNGNAKRKKPIVKLSIDEKTQTLQSADITARSEKELKKIINEVKKKYNISSNFNMFKEEHPGPIETEHDIEFNSLVLKRAIAKITYSFLAYKFPPKYTFSDSFNGIRNYICLGQNSPLTCVNFIHTKFMSDHTRPLHKIHIKVNRGSKLVVGYTMLFGIFRYTTLLSDNFGTNVDIPDLDYTYDPGADHIVYGREDYSAPSISKESILNPKQSSEYVRQELIQGYEILDSYQSDFKLLGIDINR